MAIVWLLAATPACAVIVVDSVSTTTSNCQNDGTATVYAQSTPNPFLLYKLVAGPTQSLVQSSNVFASLYPGTYTARVYDINFDSVETQFTIGGTYQLPYFFPVVHDPTCPGFTDGAIFGNADSTKGLLPFTWEIISPIVVPPQPSDVFLNLSAGTYQVRMTDACGNFQTRTAILNNDGTGLITSYQIIPYVVKIGCDTMAIGFNINLYNDKHHLPLIITVTTATGTTTDTANVSVLDSINYNPGVYFVADTVVGLDYGDYLNILITDVCGVTIGSYVNQVAPYTFVPTFIPQNADCMIELSASYALPSYPAFPYDYTALMLPVTYSLEDMSGVVIDSGTITTPTNGVQLQPHPPNTTYHLSITDGCGQLWEQDVVYPVADTPSVLTYPSLGCLDSTAVMSFALFNFLSAVTIEITSGPAFVESNQPGYAFYDTIVYPAIFPGIDVNALNGYSIKNYPAGTYTYNVFDSCGTMVSGSFTIDPQQLSDFDYVYYIERGCLGDNTLYFNAQLVTPNAISLDIFDAATGALLLHRYPVSYYTDSLTSLPPGDYVIDIFYGYNPAIGGGWYNASLTATTDCWELIDTITIPPFSDNSFESTVTVVCNGTTYVELVVDSLNGVPPYMYEIIAGPQTASPQLSNLFTLNNPGTYLFRVSDYCGNSFIQQVTVSSDTFPPIVKHGNLCVGSAIDLIAVPSSYFSYQWQLPDGAFFSGDTMHIDPLTAADTGLYVITKYVNINGCLDTFQSTYLVTLNNVNDLVAVICSGETYAVGTSIYNVTGLYTDSLVSITGCDSIIVLDLTVSDFKKDSLVTSICVGDSYTVGTNVYSQSGVYYDTLATASCDSIFKLTLTVVDYKRDTINAAVCIGSSYTLDGVSYSTTGVYTDTLATLSCDSIVLLNLTVNDFIRDTVAIQICPGDTYAFGGTSMTTSGTYVDTFASTTCDSIVTLQLVVNDFIRDTVAASICTGGVYSFGSLTLSAAGTYTDTLSTSACDSIVILNLTVTDYLRDTITASICTGNVYPFGSLNLSVAGEYIDTISTSSCDSILILYLSVNDFVRDTLHQAVCEGTFYTMGGNDYSVPGVYVDTLAASFCDSIVTLNLSVSPYARDTVNVSLCPNDSLVLGNHVYTQAGIYTDTLSTSSCDSILLINVSVLPFGFDTLYPTICDYESFSLGDNVYTYAGAYTDTVHTAACDSIVTVYLTVNPSPQVNIVASDSPVSVGDVVQLDASGFYASYWWSSVNAISSVAIKDPTVTVETSGWIYLEVENNFGCSATDSIFIEAVPIPCEARTVFVPNAFSPNDDGINDKFFAIAQNVEFEILRVYDRWGEKVFEATDVDATWDGTYKGKMTPGVYVYYVVYTGCRRDMKTGNVVLLR